jgi:hypothetical protein
VIEEYYNGLYKNFVLHDGFLFNGFRLCIPTGSLQLAIIQEAHNVRLSGRSFRAR